MYNVKKLKHVENENWLMPTNMVIKSMLNCYANTNRMSIKWLTIHCLKVMHVNGYNIMLNN